MITTVADHAAQYPNGWGGPIAIVIPFLLLWVATTGYGRWKEARQEATLPSVDKLALGTVKPQISDDSDSDDSGTEPGGGEVLLLRRSEKIEAYIAERVDRQNTTRLAREAAKKFGVSEATAWRAIRNVRGSGAA